MVRLRGMFCRQCGKTGCRVTGAYKPLPMVRVRYLKCPHCGYRFKTEERDKGPVGRPPISIDE